MLTRLGVSAILSMGVMVISLSMYSQHLYAKEFTEVPDQATKLIALGRYASLVMATPVFVLLGLPVLFNAMTQLRRGVMSTDALVVIGVGAAYAYSYVSTLTDSGAVYYETACMILVLITLGRYLEATGKLKAARAVEALDALLPDEVTVRRGDRDEVITTDALHIGDQVQIAAGERISADGTIEAGRSHIDEHLLTGESTPIVREAGSTVHAGTFNVDGALTVRVTATGSDSALGRLRALLEEAKLTKSRYERLADRVVRIFLPVVITLAAIATTTAWLRSGLDEAIMTGLAVLLIACPCALGIATPTAVWVALGKAASHGILFRNGEAIEALAKVRAIAFDKTGTLTTGEPEVTGVVAVTDGGRRHVDSESSAIETPRSLKPAAQELGGMAKPAEHEPGITENTDGGRRHVDSESSAIETPRSLKPAAQEERTGALHLALAAGLARTSKHTVSKALVRHAADTGVSPIELNNVTTVPGRGLVGKGGVSTIRLGNVAFMQESGVTIPPAIACAIAEAERNALGIAILARDDRAVAVYSFRERLRPEAQEAVAQLRALELPPRVLTGDHHERAGDVARMLGVEVLANLTPQAKIEELERLREAQGVVAMVGDGLNDAPALAAADIGVAMGCGADVTRESADICLLGNNLLDVPWAVKLARRTVRTIKVNLFWAFAYNVVGISLAMTGRLNPIIAAAAMVVSSLLVVGNSLRLSLDEASDRLHGDKGTSNVYSVQRS